jgi:acyl carrier protein
MEGVPNAVAEYIATHILPGSIAAQILQSTSLFEDGFVDSLGLQQILTHIEDQYSIEVDDDDLVPENFETVAGIAALVDRLRAA